MADQQVHRPPTGCYVYEILVDGIRRYVGKGSGDRVWFHAKQAAHINRQRAAGFSVNAGKFYNQLAKALRVGRVVEERILFAGLTSDEAFAIERSVIAEHQPGELWNAAAGGKGFSSEDVRALWADPEFRARQKVAMAAAGSKISTAVAARWQDPEYRNRVGASISAAILSDPAKRANRSKAAKAAWVALKADGRESERSQRRWADDNAREAHRAKMKAMWEDPEFRERQMQRRRDQVLSPEQVAERSSAMKEKWADPAYRQLVTEKVREAKARDWSDPEFRARATAELKARRVSAEQRRKLSDASKAKWSDPEFRARNAAGQKAGAARRKASA